MLQISSNTDVSGSSLWFEVPHHLQPVMAKFVRSKINKLTELDYKELFRSRVKETMLRSIKYSRSIPLVGGLTVYTLYGVWRFGAKGAPGAAVEANIIAEIEAFAAKQKV